MAAQQLQNVDVEFGAGGRRTGRAAAIAQVCLLLAARTAWDSSAENVDFVFPQKIQLHQRQHGRRPIGRQPIDRWSVGGLLFVLVSETKPFRVARRLSKSVSQSHRISTVATAEASGNRHHVRMWFGVGVCGQCAAIMATAASAVVRHRYRCGELLYLFLMKMKCLVCAGNRNKKKTTKL